MGLIACKPTSFPLATNLKLSTDSGEPLTNPESYRQLIGKLLYLNIIRPDMSYAIQHLSQFLSCPREPHMQAAIHLLKYLKGIVNTGLLYPIKSHFNVQANTDANWGRCVYSRKSITGYCIFLGKSLVSWKTKKQKTTSKSSAESKYCVMSDTTAELMWIAGILRDLQVSVSLPATLHCNNKVAQYIAANLVFHNRTKHIDINFHYIRDKITEGFIQTSHINSRLRLADIMTKPLPATHHHQLSLKLGLVFPPSPT